MSKKMNTFIVTLVRKIKSKNEIVSWLNVPILALNAITAIDQAMKQHGAAGWSAVSVEWGEKSNAK